MNNFFHNTLSSFSKFIFFFKHFFKSPKGGDSFSIQFLEKIRLVGLADAGRFLYFFEGFAV